MPSHDRRQLWRRRNIYLFHLVSSPLPPHVLSSHHDWQEFEEAIVTKAHFLTDMLPKTTYALLAITAFVFILMVLLPGLH